MPASALSAAVQRAWYGDSAWLRPLYPLGALTARVARRRLARFQRRNAVPPVPVLVVGNITVGGTGKTPLVIALCHALQQRGLSVAVISRGYGARPPSLPWPVSVGGDPAACGDEPLLIARSAGVPVVIDPRRDRALALVVTRDRPDLVISDDGLQHFNLPRSAEMVVLDGARGLGNGRCLPAGPLREPATRLDRVDWLVVNGDSPDFPDAWSMTLAPGAFRNAVTGETLDAEAFRARFPRVHAVAGIGHPQRFFATLRELGLDVSEQALPDHHRFRARDLKAPDERPVVITEKDAVKCAGLCHQHCWVLPVEARIAPALVDGVVEKLTGVTTA